MPFCYFSLGQRAVFSIMWDLRETRACGLSFDASRRFHASFRPIHPPALLGKPYQPTALELQNNTQPFCGRFQSQPVASELLEHGWALTPLRVLQN